MLGVRLETTANLIDKVWTQENGRPQPRPKVGTNILHTFISIQGDILHTFSRIQGDILHTFSRIQGIS